MKTVVLIPSLNPNEQLCQVIEGCMALGLTRVVVVNDGSGKAYQPIFDVVRAMGAHVLQHEKNRGKGAALRTGIQGAADIFPDTPGVVTADADGQHAPEDILRVAEALGKKPQELVMGVRDFDQGNTPSRSLMGNRISAALFYRMTKVRCQDTQTGLRGIPQDTFPLALETPGERYDYEMNLLVEIAKRRQPILMLPIATIYFDNNSGSHFRAVRDSLLIYQRPLKYFITGLSSSILDLGLFHLLTALFFGSTTAGIWYATVLARCGSGVFNFKVNQIWSFQVKNRTMMQFWKYLLLFVAVMALSSTAVSLLKFIPIHLTIIKAFVDVVLFCINYQIQRRWIFVDRSGKE